MVDEIVYMLLIVGVGFATNYLLRALPFILFAGKDRPLPKWVERFGAMISPIIIGALIVYSFATLLTLEKVPAWKTYFPYAAAAVTVLLQLVRRNPLVSIVAGTLVYMMLLNVGCTTERLLDLDAKNPSVRVSRLGVVCGDELVLPEEVPEKLEDLDVPYERTIHIRLDDDVADLSTARTLMGYLCQAGYRSPVLVTARHAASISIGKPQKKGKDIGPKKVKKTK